MGLCSRPGITSCVGIRRCVYCKTYVSGCGACGDCAGVAFGPMWKGVLMVDVLYVVLCRLPRLLALFGGLFTRFFFFDSVHILASQGAVGCPSSGLLVAALQRCCPFCLHSYACHRSPTGAHMPDQACAPMERKPSFGRGAKPVLRRHSPAHCRLARTRCRPRRGSIRPCYRPPRTQHAVPAFKRIRSGCAGDCGPAQLPAPQPMRMTLEQSRGCQ